MTKRGTGAAAGGGAVTAPDSRSLGKTEKEGSVVRHDKAFEAVQGCVGTVYVDPGRHHDHHVCG